MHWLTSEYSLRATSDRHADPVTLGAWVRSRQEIENKLHWGPRRHLSGRQIAGQNRKRGPRHGDAASLAISLLSLHGHTNIAAATSATRSGR